MQFDNMKRRTFIKAIFGAAVALPLMQLPRLALAAKKEAAKSGEKETAKAASAPLPEGKKACTNADPVASAIGYVEDAKNADLKKFPQAKGKAGKDQFCNNCALYTTLNAGWGNCQMITGCVVANKGWCGSWSKKA